MIAGAIDISVGSMLGLGGVAGALYMSNNYHGGNGFTSAAGSAGTGLLIVGTLISIGVGLGGGLLNGSLVAYLKINSLIVTLATYGAFLGFADLISNGVPVVNLPPASVTVGTGEVWNIPYIVFIAAFIALVLSWVAKNTRFGRYTYAVGASREAVRRSGVNLGKHTLMLFGMAGALAGLAGMINAAHFQTASSTSGANDLLVAIAAVVIGGTPLTGGEGRIWGTVVGALIYTLLENGFVLMNVPSFWQLPVIGLLIIIAVSLDQYQRRCPRRAQRLPQPGGHYRGQPGRRRWPGWNGGRKSEDRGPTECRHAAEAAAVTVFFTGIPTGRPRCGPRS